MPTEYYGYKALRVEVYGVLLSTGTNSIFSVPYHWNPTSVAKRGGEYYDLPYLKCYVKSHSLSHKWYTFEWYMYMLYICKL